MRKSKNVTCWEYAKRNHYY